MSRHREIYVQRPHYNWLYLLRCSTIGDWAFSCRHCMCLECSSALSIICTITSYLQTTFKDASVPSEFLFVVRPIVQCSWSGSFHDSVTLILSYMVIMMMTVVEHCCWQWRSSDVDPTWSIWSAFESVNQKIGDILRSRQHRTPLVCYNAVKAYQPHISDSVFTTSQKYIFNVHQIITSARKFNIFLARSQTKIPLRIHHNTPFQVKNSWCGLDDLSDMRRLLKFSGPDQAVF